jgi:prepilin-type N-terminal cleavage/methylation domain-containing protein
VPVRDATRRGFTLMELLIGMAVMGIAVVYMLESVTFGNRTYTVLDQVVESQQSMRAVASLIEYDLRHAGMMVPIGAAICGVDNTASPDLLFVSDADAIDSGDDIAPYDGARIAGGATNVTGSSATITVDSLILEPAPPTRAAYDVNGDGTMDSDFQVGGGVIIMDLDDPSRGTVCGRIRAIDVGAASIVVDPLVTPGLTAAASARLVAIPAHHYRIINGDELRRDGMLLSSGVEDLQLAYFLDADGDDLVDAGEMKGETSGSGYTAQGTDMEDLREVRLNLVVRTRAEDEDFSGQQQTTENRAAGADDGFRRRVYTASVLPRNLFGRLGS